MILKFFKGIVFLSVTTLGTLGNISVSVNYMLSFWRGTEKKPVHLIFLHLAFTNIIILLAKGLPKTVASFGLRNFLDEMGCKILVYLERVARSLSICISSLLTLIQAIILSPKASVWRKLRPRSAWHILPFFSFFWILNSWIGMNLIHSITSSNLNISQVKNADNYCYVVRESQKIKWIFLFLMVLRDSVFQGVMGGASGYMLFLLHEHHQRVLYVQNSKFLCTAPPELRAAQRVLLLMLCFIFFCGTDCAMSVFLSLSLGNNDVMVNVQEFLVLGYAVFSPFVLLIHRDALLTEYWHAQWEKLRMLLSQLFAHYV